jgi:hypothetical protein
LARSSGIHDIRTAATPKVQPSRNPDQYGAG